MASKKNGKSSVIIPHEMVSKFGTLPNYPQKHAESLQSKASSFLARNDIPDEVKFTQYAQAQQRFLAAKKEIEKPHRLELESDDDGKSNAVLQNYVNALEEMPEMQIRFRRLADHLLGVQGLKWNSAGEIEVDGMHIPGSNIGALMRDYLMPTAGSAPRGNVQFYDVLSRSKVPAELMYAEAGRHTSDRWDETDEPRYSSTPTRPGQSSTLPPWFRTTVPAPPQPYFAPPTRQAMFHYFDRDPAERSELTLLRTPVYPQGLFTPGPNRRTPHFRHFLSPRGEETILPQSGFTMPLRTPLPVTQLRELTMLPQEPTPSQRRGQAPEANGEASTSGTRRALFQELANLEVTPGSYPWPAASTRSQYNLTNVEARQLFNAAQAAHDRRHRRAPRTRPWWNRRGQSGQSGRGIWKAWSAV
jgi:hypothetical protein